MTAYRPLDSRCVRGIGVVRRGEPAEDRRHEVADVGGALDLLRARPGDQHVARHPLLEQELRGPDHRIGVEALDHRRSVQDVADGDQQHALVVRHVAHHRRHRSRPRAAAVACSRGPRGTRTVRPHRPGAAARSSGRRPRASIMAAETGRVRRDHEVVAEAALEAEPRDPEARVLVDLVEVARVERGLGDPPRDASRGAA